MTAAAQRLLDLLHDVEESSYRDGRAMNDPEGSTQITELTYKATRTARLMIIQHLRTMTTKDLKSL